MRKYILILAAAGLVAISALSTHAAIINVPADQPTIQAGIDAAVAGDVNNNGFDDLIVGAHLNDAGGHDAGQAYVFSGQSGDLLHTSHEALDALGESRKNEKSRKVMFMLDWLLSCSL